MEQGTCDWVQTAPAVAPARSQRRRHRADDVEHLRPEGEGQGAAVQRVGGVEWAALVAFQAARCLAGTVPCRRGCRKVDVTVAPAPSLQALRSRCRWAEQPSLLGLPALQAEGPEEVAHPVAGQALPDLL